MASPLTRRINTSDLDCYFKTGTSSLLRDLTAISEPGMAGSCLTKPQHWRRKQSLTPSQLEVTLAFGCQATGWPPTPAGTYILRLETVRSRTAQTSGITSSSSVRFHPDFRPFLTLLPQN